jgi:hypothetical protein
LPELGGGQELATDWDVRVALDGLDTRLPPGEARVEADRCAFHPPEAGSYEVRDGQTIAVEPAVGAAPEVVRTFLLGSAWGALLQQRGELPLHGAVVSGERGAIAFCGPQTAGKSSTAAWLVRRGLRLVSDDLARLEVPPGAGAPRVWPSHRAIKLGSEALLALGRGPEGLAREPSPDGPRAGKYLLPSSDRANGPVPLHAICLLEWGEARLSEVTGARALRSFVAAATYRTAFLSDPRDLARHWELCTEVVRRVPVWQLTRPRNWAAMENVVDGLLAPLVADR